MWVCRDCQRKDLNIAGQLSDNVFALRTVCRDALISEKKSEIKRKAFFKS